MRRPIASLCSQTYPTIGIKRSRIENARKTWRKNAASCERPEETLGVWGSRQCADRQIGLLLGLAEGSKLPLHNTRGHTARVWSGTSSSSKGLDHDTDGRGVGENERRESGDAFRKRAGGRRGQRPLHPSKTRERASWCDPRAGCVRTISNYFDACGNFPAICDSTYPK